MVNEDLTSLIGVWKKVEGRRLRTYDHKGVLYLKKDTDGVIQEKYFSSFEEFARHYSGLNMEGLIVDLSDKQQRP